MRKNIYTFLAVAFVAGLLAGCGSKDSGKDTTIVVGASPAPHAEILEAAKPVLEKAGYTVVYTRTSDEVSWSNDNKDDLRTRVAIAKEAGADYYISIHTNASEYGDGASGFEAYIDYKNDTITAMAQSIEQKLMQLGYTQNRGLKSTQDSSLYVIDSNPVPAMLLELGFITDSADAAYMCSEEGQNALVQSIAQGILEQL